MNSICFAYVLFVLLDFFSFQPILSIYNLAYYIFLWPLKKVLQSFVVKIGPGHTSIKKVYKNWCNFFPPQLYILSTFEEGCLFCYLISFLLSHEIKSLSSGFQIFAMIFLYSRQNLSRQKKVEKNLHYLAGGNTKTYTYFQQKIPKMFVSTSDTLPKYQST